MTEAISLKIDIVSDVVCPWCVIGYKQVEKALTMLDKPVEAAFWWHPFELNRDMVPEGQDVAEHIQQKYGSTPEQSADNRQRLAEIGASVGFEFGHHENRRIYNSFKAHKLLRNTGEKHGWRKQTDLKLALFAAYFTLGQNVSDDIVLLDVAASVGLDRDTCVEWLADDALSSAVRAEQSHWLEKNITGVPAIIFDQHFMVPGAQSAETFADVITKVLAKRAAA